METLYKQLYSWSSYLNSLDNLGLMGLRFSIAGIFIAHGIGKLGMWKMKPSNEMPVSMLNILRFLSIAESLGSLALFFGFLTQFAAIGLGLIMLGAIYFKMRIWKTGFISEQGTGWEFDLILLGGCLALATIGGGDISIDRIFLNL